MEQLVQALKLTQTTDEEFDHLWAAKGVEFGVQGLTLPPGLAFEDWELLGSTLLAMFKGVQWWIGDWLRFGEHHYGEKYAQAIDGYSADALRNLVWVAERFGDLSSRDDRLTWSHHRVVAPLPTPEDRKEWLDKAVEHNWTTRELAEHVQGVKHPVPALPEPNGLLLTRPQAIEFYHTALNGIDYERAQFLAKFKVGKTAKDLWDDPGFMLGMGYGVRLALAHAFGLTPKEVKE